MRSLRGPKWLVCLSASFSRSLNRGSLFSATHMGASELLEVLLVSQTAKPSSEAAKHDSKAWTGHSHVDLPRIEGTRARSSAAPVAVGENPSQDAPKNQKGGERGSSRRPTTSLGLNQPIVEIQQTSHWSTGGLTNMGGQPSRKGRNGADVWPLVKPDLLLRVE